MKFSNKDRKIRALEALQFLQHTGQYIWKNIMIIGVEPAFAVLFGLFTVGYCSENFTYKIES